MRSFIAIDFNELKEHFQSLQKRIEIPSTKISLAKTFHLTLKFLGEVQPNTLLLIKDKLNSIKFTDFKLFTNAIGFFPSESMPRVIWIGLKPEDELIALQKSIDESLKDIFKLENNFKPHITLARVKSIEDKDIFCNSVSKFQTSPKSIHVKEFKLFKSTLTKQGATHESIAAYNSLP